MSHLITEHIYSAEITNERKERKHNKLKQLGTVPNDNIFREKMMSNSKKHPSNTMQGTEHIQTNSVLSKKKYMLGVPQFPVIAKSVRTLSQEDEIDENDDIKEELMLIKTMWNDLGVNKEYQSLFEMSLYQFKGKLKKDLLNMESQSLKRFKDNIMKLSKEILNREKIIATIESYDNNMSKGSIKFNDSFVKDFLLTIKTYRIHSINIVNYMNKIRELSAYSVFSGKYNLDNLSPGYSYNRNYLIKMRNDLDFLKQSYLSQYFLFIESDPFLMNISSTSDDTSNSQYIAPIHEDMIPLIIQCNYIIMQDLLYSRLNHSNRKESKCASERKQTPGYDSMIDLFKTNKANIVKLEKTSKIYNVNMSQLLHKMKKSADYNTLFVSRNTSEKKYYKEFSTVNSNHHRSQNLKIKFANEGLQSMTRDELLSKFDKYDKNQIELAKEEEQQYGMETLRTKSGDKVDNDILSHCTNNQSDINHKELKVSNKNKNDKCKTKRLTKDSIETNDNDNNYNVTFYKESLKSLIENTYKDYFQRIPNEHKITMKSISYDDINFVQGFNPKIIIVSQKNNKSIIAICQVAYTSLSSPEITLRINHLSTIDNNHWECVYSSIMNFIKSTFKYNKIEVKLFYEYDNDNHFKINKEILSFFKTKHQFQWHKIENSINHERIQYLLYTNPNNEKAVTQPFNHFCIKTSSLLSLTENSIEPSYQYDKYLNVFSLKFLLNSLKQNGITLLTENKIKASMIEWKSQDMLINLKNLITIKTNSTLKSLKSNNSFFNLEKLSLKEDNESTLSYCSINYKPLLSNNISIVKDGIIYNCIQGNISILQDSLIGQKMYIIPTEDYNNSIFICEMNTHLKNLFFDSDKNIYELFFDYYQNLKQNDQETHLHNSLWIPSFTINTHLLSNHLSTFDDIDINSEEGKRLFVKSIDDYIHVDYKGDNDLKSSFLIELEKNDVLIKDTFIFGIINHSLMSEMNIPSILLLIVTPEHWNKQ